MKRIMALAIILFIPFTQGCRKDTPGSEDISLTKKYARFATAVYKNREMTDWLATLSKTEAVDLLAVEKVLIKNKPVEVASVKLSDDSKGFVAMANLADKPLVFIEDTKAHVRNNTGSRVEATIPRGTIGFIIEEKGNWVQIHIGKVGEKFITKLWVEGGFSTDQALVIEARAYEESCAVVSRKKENVKPQEWQEALDRLNELKSSSSIFAGLATDKLAAIEGSAPAGEQKEEMSGSNDTDRNDGNGQPQ